MATHNKKQFGIWMDGHHATVVGKSDPDSSIFEVLGHVTKESTGGNSNENANNHQEISLRQKFFKEIAAIMPNVDEVHVTGTGQAQEQFIHFLADTAQYKNTVATESTSNKMGDEEFVEFVDKHFN
jgi:stalled ribosome rescue protein Dom34